MNANEVASVFIFFLRVTLTVTFGPNAEYFIAEKQISHHIFFFPWLLVDVCTYSGFGAAVT